MRNRLGWLWVALGAAGCVGQPDDERSAGALTQPAPQPCMLSGVGPDGELEMLPGQVVSLPPAQCAALRGATLGSTGAPSGPPQPARLKRGKQARRIRGLQDLLDSSLVPEGLWTSDPGPAPYTQDGGHDCDDFADELEQELEDWGFHGTFTVWWRWKWVDVPDVAPAADEVPDDEPEPGEEPGDVEPEVRTHRELRFDWSHAITDVHDPVTGEIIWIEPQTGLPVNLDFNGDGVVSYASGSNPGAPTEGTFDQIMVFENVNHAAAHCGID